MGSELDGPLDPFHLRRTERNGVKSDQQGNIPLPTDPTISPTRFQLAAVVYFYFSLLPKSNKAAKFNDGDSLNSLFCPSLTLFLAHQLDLFAIVAGTLKSSRSQISSISSLLLNASDFIGGIARLFFSAGGVMEEPGQLKRAVIDTTAGLVAGGISRTVTSPLDVIKIRFQVWFPYLANAISL